MLSQLPAELVILVALQLNKKSLLNLILCCRQFHELLLPYLYRTMYLMNSRGAYDSHLCSLVETVAASPRLACAVRLLAFEKTFGNSNEVKSNGIPSFANSLVPTFCVTEEEQTQWYEDLAEGNGDSWIALLLPRLCNLQRLYVSVNIDMKYFYKILECATVGVKSVDTPPIFSALSHVNISWYDRYYGGLELSRTFPFFRLPSMRSFTGVAITEGYLSGESDDEFDGPFSETPLAGSSPITSIEFYTSNGAKGMFDAIRSCAKLEKFIYEHADGAMHGSGFDPCAFRRSLENSKTTLQTLWLDYDEGHYALGYDNEDDYFGSLIEFTALRTVRLRINQLFDLYGFDSGRHQTPLANTLPASLESMWITDCYDPQFSTIIPELMTVVANRQELTPRLVELVIQGQFEINQVINRKDDVRDVSPDSMIIPDVYEETRVLREACESTGIKFEILDDYFMENQVRDSPLHY